MKEGSFTGNSGSFSSDSEGKPTKKGPSKALKIIIGVVVILVVIIIIGALAGESGSTPLTPTPTSTTSTQASALPTYTPIPTTQPCEGASGICNDGSCTNAANKQGACSYHGGVRTWFK